MPEKFWDCNSRFGGLGAAPYCREEPSLASLEKSWMALPADYARVAYGWSLATIEGVAQAGTSIDIERLLDALAAGSSTEASVRSVLHMDYSELNRSTADYLRHAYGH